MKTRSPAKAVVVERVKGTVSRMADDAKKIGLSLYAEFLKSGKKSQSLTVQESEDLIRPAEEESDRVALEVERSLRHNK